VVERLANQKTRSSTSSSASKLQVASKTEQTHLFSSSCSSLHPPYFLINPSSRSRFTAPPILRAFISHHVIERSPLHHVKVTMASNPPNVPSRSGSIVNGPPSAGINPSQTASVPPPTPGGASQQANLNQIVCILWSTIV
jgi:hypothetical protein